MRRDCGGGCGGDGVLQDTWRRRVDAGFLKNKVFLIGRREDICEPISVSLEA